MEKGGGVERQGGVGRIAIGAITVGSDIFSFPPSESILSPHGLSASLISSYPIATSSKNMPKTSDFLLNAMYT